MTSTKTKSPTHAELVAESHKALADAESLLAERAAELDTAKGVVASIRDAARTGGDADAGELVTARAAVELAEGRLAYAQTVVAKAKRGLLHDETTLAVLVSQLVTDVTGLEGTVSPIGAVADVPSDRPTVCVVQMVPTKYNGMEGDLAGTVEIVYRHNAFHRSPDWNALQRHCDELRGIVLKVRPGSLKDLGSGITEERAKVAVEHIWPTLPDLPMIVGDLHEFRIQGFRSFVPNEVKRLLPAPYGAKRQGIRILSGDGASGVTGATVSEVAATASAPEVVSKAVDAEGVRRLVIEMVVNAWLPKASEIYTADQLQSTLHRVVDDLVGTGHTGIGTVTQSTVVESIPYSHGRDSRGLRIRVEFSSRLAPQK